MREAHTRSLNIEIVHLPPLLILVKLNRFTARANVLLKVTAHSSPLSVARVQWGVARLDHSAASGASGERDTARLGERTLDAQLMLALKRHSGDRERRTRMKYIKRRTHCVFLCHGQPARSMPMTLCFFFAQCAARIVQIIILLRCSSLPSAGDLIYGGKSATITGTLEGESLTAPNSRKFTIKTECTKKRVISGFAGVVDFEPSESLVC